MKTLVSGIQPSGKLTLGNYLGAIRNFVNMTNNSDEYESYIFIADLHAITVPKNPTDLRKQIKQLAALYLACGLNPEKVNLFIQSEVVEHAQMGYVLQTITYIGELERMTQFKDKKEKQETGVSSALLTYPVLMAGDILLYNADCVPVGLDQKQHLELTRMIAERFNNRFSPTFTIPEPIINKTNAKIMSLTDPTKKMSKSDENEKSSIYLLDDKNTIMKKIASSVTDCVGKINFDPINQPGISNLLSIYASCKDLSIEETLSQLKDLTYQELKVKVAEAVIEVLEPIQAKYNEFINSPIIDEVLNEGAMKASFKARKTLSKVYHKMGLGRK